MVREEKRAEKRKSRKEKEQKRERAEKRKAEKRKAEKEKVGERENVQKATLLSHIKPTIVTRKSIKKTVTLCMRDGLLFFYERYRILFYCVLEIQIHQIVPGLPTDAVLHRGNAHLHFLKHILGQRNNLCT